MSGSNLPPAKMAARSRLCECGHPEANHYSLNTGGSGGACQATVYEIFNQGPLTSGGNARACACTGFALAAPGETEQTP